MRATHQRDTEAYCKEMDRLIRLVKSHKIDYDPRFIIINTDGLLQLCRADFIPTGEGQAYWNMLKTI
jgi:hypothetical protein